MVFNFFVGACEPTALYVASPLHVGEISGRVVVVAMNCPNRLDQSKVSPLLKQ
jgi:hypothetical protein